jgi:ABC-type branched-subunit amino acid transport system ATPase component
MTPLARSAPRCIIIAGPNGAGKTTFAREFLTKEAGVIHFVNADLIASGLSPLRPELATLAAGRLFLRELDRLARTRADFAFESTHSGLTYVTRLKRLESGRLANRNRLLADIIAAVGAAADRRSGQARRSQCAAARCAPAFYAQQEQL